MKVSSALSGSHQFAGAGKVITVHHSNLYPTILPAPAKWSLEQDWQHRMNARNGL